MKSFKKRLKMSLIIVVMFFATVSLGFTFPINPGDTVIMDASWGDNYGVKAENGIIYNTFCLESNITFSNQVPYFVESVGSVAVSGGRTTSFADITSIKESDGSSFVSTGDPVADETYWLYASYFEGLFNTFGTGQSLINKVQSAIWFSEEEVPAGSSGELYFNDFTLLANDDFTVQGWDIQVMNIVGGPDKDRQSQLVGVNPVPEPSTIMLFGFGLVGLAGIGRRKMVR